MVNNFRPASKVREEVPLLSALFLPMLRGEKGRLLIGFQRLFMGLRRMFHGLLGMFFARLMIFLAVMCGRSAMRVRR
jgi:hypothetical protein